MRRAPRLAVALAVLLSSTPPTGAAEDPPPESLSPRALRGARLADLGFLAGAWYGGERDDASWQFVACPAGDRMVGLQEDVRDGASRFFELQVYAQRGDFVVFLASPLGRPATPFVAIEVGANRAVFENAGHDFPQRIVMQVAGEELSVRIEGEADGETRSSEWRWGRVASAASLLPHCAAA